jgi:hypothetical protein
LNRVFARGAAQGFADVAHDPRGAQTVPRDIAD